jgi:hypothetical protein
MALCQKMAYKILKFTVQNNPRNEIYVSQWFQLILEHTLECKESNNLLAEATLISLISNNRQLIEENIDEEIIQKIVKALYTRKSKTYIRVLKAFLSVNNKAI